MASSSNKIKCTDCGHPFTTEADAVRPCPECASTSRTRSICVSDTLAVATDYELDLRGKSAAKRKRTPESQNRPARIRRVRVFRDRKGIRRRLERTVDGDAGYYEEKVIEDSTGDVLYWDWSIIDLHVGHGTQQRERFPDAVSRAISTIASNDRGPTTRLTK
jgi:hypothetical protein